MGFLDTLTKPFEELERARKKIPSILDPVEVLTHPGDTGQEALDMLRDPLSGLQGLPGISGDEATEDGGRLEVARQDQTQAVETKRKTTALIAKRKEETDRKSTILTGPEGLASDDKASIATRSLLG